MATRYKKEAILAAVLVGFGLLVLPLAIYMVGGQIVGPYEGEGVWGLAVVIWQALSRGQSAAWILVLSPYAVVQLARLAVRLARRPRVNAVTE
jgi:hypothetical protein